MRRTLSLLLAMVAFWSVEGSAGPPEVRLRKTTGVQKVLPRRIAFSPDGRHVAVSGQIQKMTVGEGPGLNLQMTDIERVMLLVDARDFKEKRRFMKGPQKDIFGSDPVTFSADGRRVIAVVDSSIRVWDSDRGKQLGSWGQNLSTVVFSGDRRFALAKHTDGSYELFDLADGRSLGSYRADEHGEMLAMDAERPGLVYVKNNNLTLKNLKTGEETILGEWPAKSVEGAALGPDNKTLAVADGAGKVALWDMASRKKLGERAEGNRAARSLTFSPDGSMLAYLTEQKVNLWSVADGSIAAVDPQHIMGTGNLVFSGDSRTLATLGILVDPQIKLWDVTPPPAPRAEVARAPEQATTPTAAPAPPASTEAQARAWDSLEAHAGGVRAIAFSSDGKWLATGGDDNTVKLWDFAAGREVRTFTGHTDEIDDVAFSRDGQWLASGGKDKMVKIWEVATGREVRTLTGHTERVEGVAFSPDGRWLASGSSDKNVKIWEVASGREVRNLTGHTDSVTEVVFSPDGRLLASASWDKTVKLWEVESWRELRTLAGHKEITKMSRTPGGFQIQMTMAGLYDIAFSADGNLLATASNDKTVKIWEVAKGRERRTLTGHANGVQTVAFSPDGRWVATANDEEAIRLWEVNSGREMRRFGDGAKTVAFSPDGRWLVAGSGDGKVKRWEVAGGR